jgi:hypothetical protein
MTKQLSQINEHGEKAIEGSAEEAQATIASAFTAEASCLC